MNKTSLSRLLLASCLSLACATGAWAQAWPTQQIKIIVGFPAGGASDVAARLIGQKLSERLGKPVVVENRAGAAGNVGAEAVAKAAPDGHTLLLGTISLSINPGLYPKLPYDPLKDFAAISMIASTPFMLVVHPGTPYMTIKDLVDAAKAGKTIHYATAGNGSGSHLFMELFTHTAGIKLTHVPYKGAAPAMNDVMGGQVPVAFDNILTALPLSKGGKVRALGVSTKARSKVAPDVPSLAEGGITNFDATAWFALFAPAGTPRDIIMRLNREVAEAVKDPAISEKLLALGADAVSSTPEQLDAFYRSEVARWGQVVRQARVTID
jgi:tripartite-type tricarboxylate transporter receptor subunit TctC